MLGVGQALVCSPLLGQYLKAVAEDGAGPRSPHEGSCLHVLAGLAPLLPLVGVIVVCMRLRCAVVKMVMLLGGYRALAVGQEWVTCKPTIRVCGRPQLGGPGVRGVRPQWASRARPNQGK